MTPPIGSLCPRRTVVRAAAALLLCASACTVIPATGERAFTGLMTPRAEERLGEEAHAEVLNAFDGEYDDPALARYVSAVGERLARTTERPELTFRFTILDSPIVNAFATPGGYIYVTRGLLALIDDEAQLAAVMAHELGHITGRHHARRHGRELLVGLGLQALGALTGQQQVLQGTEVAALLYLRAYSREEEYQADVLGVRYLARAGYSPDSLASLLVKFEAKAELDALLLRQPRGTLDQFDYLSTHPNTAERVRRAIAAADAKAVAEPAIGRAQYLDAIDGMLYGDSAKQGFIRGQTFAHPILKITFDVPAEYRLFNSKTRVYAVGPDGAVMAFDMAARPVAASMREYLERDWAQQLVLRDVREQAIGGLDAATASTRLQTARGAVDLRLAAIRVDAARVFRFRFVTPAAHSARLAPLITRSIESFRTLSDAEARALKPLRVRVIEVGAEDTVESLALRMAYSDHQIERFRVLNGLTPMSRLYPGQRVKIAAQ